MSMLKQVAEVLPEIDENGFLKWLNKIPEEKLLSEKKELIKRNYNGTWLEASQED